MIQMASPCGFEYKELVIEGPAAALLSAADVDGWELAATRNGGWQGSTRDNAGTWNERAVTFVLKRPRQVDPPNQARQDARRGKR